VIVVRGVPVSVMHIVHVVTVRDRDMPAALAMNMVVPGVFAIFGRCRHRLTPFQDQAAIIPRAADPHGHPTAPGVGVNIG
jgi:hypothetical protein